MFRLLVDRKLVNETEPKGRARLRWRTDCCVTFEVLWSSAAECSLLLLFDFTLQNPPEFEQQLTLQEH